MEKGIIICGFAGIGKSKLALSNKIVDLESTPFDKNWELYSNVAIHMANNGYNVAVSCHKELREILVEKHAHFVTVMPSIEDKDDYLFRYSRRGSSKDFIELMSKNWNSFTTEIIKGEIILRLNTREEDAKYLSDVYETILNYSRLLDC